MPSSKQHIIPNTAANAMQNHTQQFQYDELGNILQMKSAGKWTRDYYYNFTNNNYLQGHTANTTEYTYDQHEGGALKKYPVDIFSERASLSRWLLSMPHLSEMVWNYKDQLNKVNLDGGGTAYYVYDATGERVRKVIEKGNSIEERYYLGDYEVYRKTTNGSLNIERQTVHISDDQKRIAMVDNDRATETIRYQYDNHLGSASLELDHNANIISYEEYHPFGTTSYRSGRTETEVSRKRYKYVGKERDEETGLYYYGARYYAGGVARFVSVDPMAHLRTWVSPYNYCQNNPINKIDPDGALDDDPPNTLATPQPNYVAVRDATRVALPNTIQFIEESKNIDDPTSRHQTGPGHYSANVKSRYIGFGFRHPVASLRIGFGVTSGKTDISTNSTRFATRGEVLFGSKRSQVDEGSENGAFRHCLWQATIASEFSGSVAAQAGNAHEENPFADLSIRSFTSLAEADQTVDLLNNIIGRSIGVTNKEANMDNLANLVLDEFKNNGLYTASRHKNGNWVISKTKLSSEKYNQLKKIFKGLNKNGRTATEQNSSDAKAQKRLERLQQTWGTMK